MKNKKLFVGIVLLVAILLLGIGYAAISAVPLSITGNLKATPDDENFKVYFTGTPSTVAGSKGTATGTVDATDPTKATINVEGLKAKGDTATVTYTVENGSPDLSAALSVKTETVSNTEYFSVDATVEDPTTVAAKGKTTVTVVVSLIKTPVEAEVTSTVTIALDAEPVQP